MPVMNTVFPRSVSTEARYLRTGGRRHKRPGSTWMARTGPDLRCLSMSIESRRAGRIKR